MLREGRRVDLRWERLKVVLRDQINSTSKARVEISRREIEIELKIFISVKISTTRRQIRGISVAVTSGARRISAGRATIHAATDLAAENLGRYVSILTAWVPLLLKSVRLG
jgi:hypothetical protein